MGIFVLLKKIYGHFVSVGGILTIFSRFEEGGIDAINNLEKYKQFGDSLRGM
jgi:hypothetical protein